MAANFAGVNISDDSRNDIVGRGNSPTGLLWRMEGVAIPNPNHYSTLGTTGGPVSALNTNLLKNSDFLTSAFPAEYGNALSGVFDIQLRSGNKENHEYTFNFLAGKEVKIGKDKRNALTFDTKFTTAGGRFYTPIDLAASIAAGEQVWQEDKAYSERIDSCMRWDVKFGYRLNSKKNGSCHSSFSSISRT